MKKRIFGLIIGIIVLISFMSGVLAAPGDISYVHDTSFTPTVIRGPNHETAWEGGSLANVIDKNHGTYFWRRDLQAPHPEGQWENSEVDVLFGVTVPQLNSVSYHLTELSALTYYYGFDVWAIHSDDSISSIHSSGVSTFPGTSGGGNTVNTITNVNLQDVKGIRARVSHSYRNGNQGSIEYRSIIYEVDAFGPVLAPPYINSGLRIYNGTNVVSIVADPAGSKLKMWNGTNIVNISLIDNVDLGGVDDSGFRIYLDGEVKGLRKY